ncbi:FAD-dependent oxidoreductase, partial [Shewanella sp. 0m-11]
GDVEALKTRVVDSFCGIRVLPKQAGNSFDRPRDTLQKSQLSHPKLLSLYGGKLTTYRTTATEVLEWVEDSIGKRQPLADFERLMLD